MRCESAESSRLVRGAPKRRRPSEGNAPAILSSSSRLRRKYTEHACLSTIPKARCETTSNVFNSVVFRLQKTTPHLVVWMEDGQEDLTLNCIWNRYGIEIMVPQSAISKLMTARMREKVQKLAHSGAAGFVPIEVIGGVSRVAETEGVVSSAL